MFYFWLFFHILKKEGIGDGDMIHYIWGFMIVIGIVVSVITGETASVNTSVIDGAKDAVSLCITMLGIMAFWTGLMEVAKEAGIIGYLTRKLEKILGWLFPGVPKDHAAREYMASNMIANIMGLGWAATPMGLKAMGELAKLEEENPTVPKGTASRAMCTFLIINVSSLQLIPINVIAYRSQYGSVNPAAILGSGLVATFISTAVAIFFCKIMDNTLKKTKFIK